MCLSLLGKDRVRTCRVAAVADVLMVLYGAFVARSKELIHLRVLRIEPGDHTTPDINSDSQTTTANESRTVDSPSFVPVTHTHTFIPFCSAFYNLVLLPIDSFFLPVTNSTPPPPRPPTTTTIISTPPLPPLPPLPLPSLLLLLLPLPRRLLLLPLPLVVTVDPNPSVKLSQVMLKELSM